MESEPRFDLNSALIRWSADLATRGNLAPGKIAELETHLRDSVAALQQRGLNDAEAFLIATRRLGSPAQIETEFEKVDATVLPRRALWWLVLGVAGWTTLNSAIHALNSLLVLAGSSIATNQTTATAMVVTAKLLSFSFLVWVLVAIAKHPIRLHAMGIAIARHPWRLVGGVMLANVLCWCANSFFWMFLFRLTTLDLVGTIASISSMASYVNGFALIGLLAFVLAKMRPAYLASQVQ